FPADKFSQVLRAFTHKNDYLTRSFHSFPQFGLYVVFVLSTASHRAEVVGISKIELDAIVYLPTFHVTVRPLVVVPIENDVGCSGAHAFPPAGSSQCA